MEESEPKPESPAVKEPKKAARSRAKEKVGKEKRLLMMELTEIKEISDIIFKRIEKQIEALKTIEASIDKKIETLRRLDRGENLPEKQPEEAASLSEVRSLRQKGLGVKEIADVLKIPAGEVDLMINLEKDREDAADLGGDVQKEQKRIPGKQIPRRTSSQFLSRRILVGLLLTIFTAILAAYLFLPRWYSPSLIPLSKSDQVADQQQIPPILVQPLEPAQPQKPEEEIPQDIDSIRKKYSLASIPQAIEKKPPIRGEKVLKEENQSTALFEQGKKGNAVTIITNAATIREKPELKSNPVAWVSKGVVLEVREDFTDSSGKKWNRVVTSDGREGWIADSVVKSSS